MLDALQKLPTRMLVLIGGAVFGLTLLACYLYLFKQPLAQYRQLASQYSRSLADLENQRNSFDAGQIDALRAAIHQAEDRLYGKGPRPGARDMVPHVVGELDRLSQDHAVRLRSVKPGTVETVLMFDEVPFDVSVQGRYFDLYGWLLAVESELRPMVVKHFSIREGRNGEDLQMSLRIVSYLSREDAS